MRKLWLILMDPNAGGGNGSGNQGGDGGENGPLRLAQNEAIEWRNKYTNLKADFDKLQGDYNTLDKNHAKTIKTLEETQGELGKFTAADARKSKITELLGHKDYKDKVKVDVDRAMKFLARGAFDEANLEKDVREAIEFVGEAIKPPSSGLAPTGAGNDATERPKVSADPIGSLVRSGSI